MLRWDGMVVVLACDSPLLGGVVERFLIRIYKNNRGCQNIKEGGTMWELKGCPLFLSM